MYLFIGLNLPAGCKQNAFEVHLDVSEIYFRCNLNVLIIGLDKAAGCKQNAFEKHLDVSHIHLKFALNSHAHKLYEPRWVKELPLQNLNPFKMYLERIFKCHPNYI